MVVIIWPPRPLASSSSIAAITPRAQSIYTVSRLLTPILFFNSFCQYVFIETIISKWFLTLQIILSLQTNGCRMFFVFLFSSSSLDWIGLVFKLFLSSSSLKVREENSRPFFLIYGLLFFFVLAAEWRSYRHRFLQPAAPPTNLQMSFFFVLYL